MVENSTVKTLGCIDVDEVVNAVSLSGCLGKSQRQQVLFRYLLDKSLSGQHLSVSQYSIAFDVMQRDETFDANIDSIVRVEMHRLRSNLKKFNAQSKHFKIDIASGQYLVKVTELNEMSPSSMIAKSKGTHIGAYAKTILGASIIFIAGFNLANAIDLKKSRVIQACSSVLPNISTENFGQSSGTQELIDGIIKGTLSQHTHLNVMPYTHGCLKRGAPSFTINYKLIENAENKKVAIKVKQNSSDKIIRYEMITFDQSDSEQTELSKANIIRFINETAKTYGLISRTALTETWSDEGSFQNFQCLVSLYDYFATEDQEAYDYTQSCLLKAHESGNAPLDISGALAANYIEQARGFRDGEESDPLLRAKEILDAHKNDWVNSIELITAKLHYELEREDYNIDRLRDILGVAEARYSSNPQALATLTAYMGYSLGNWEKAQTLSSRLKLIHTDRDQSVFYVDAAYAFLNENNTELMDRCLDAYSPNNDLVNILTYACAKKSGDEEWKKISRDNLKRLGLITHTDIINAIQGYKLDRKFEKHLVDKITL